MQKFSGTLLLMLVAAWCGSAGAQSNPFSTGQASRIVAASSHFDDDVMATRESDSTARVDVFVRIPYKKLSFIREEEMYTARYDVTVQFRVHTDSVIKEKTFFESVREPSYEATIGRTGKFAFHQKTFSIPVGEYKVAVTVTDNTTKQPYTDTKTMRVDDYKHAAVSMSGILFAESIADMSGKRSITPHIQHDVSSMRQGAFVFFETYAAKRDTLDAVYSCVLQKKETMRSKRIPIVVDSGVSRHFFKVQTEQLSHGEYTLEIALVPHVADTNKIAELDSPRAKMFRTFSVEWGTGLPETEDDLEHAVSQLRWVATADEMDFILDRPTIEAKRDAYKKFWDERDPTPGTPRNEAMELYMARVQYANENFKGFGGEGYMNDRGMVYVIFGDPTSIESHPTDYITYGIYHGPYIIWYYERYNRTYIFIDQDGFGNFRIASTPPIERFQYGQ